jgi:tellurite resistance protein
MDLGDIFKEKIKWTEDELSSLLSILTYQAAIDGKIDEEEKRTIENAILNLPGTKPLNWNILMEKSIELSTTSEGNIASINTLKKMHSNKRKLVIATLYNLADADGNVDEKEKEVFINIAKILNVNTGKKNFSDLGFQIKDGVLYTPIKFTKSKVIEEQQESSQKTLSEPLLEYLKDRPNINRIYTEFTHSIRNGFTVKKYLNEANLMDSEEIMFVVSWSFLDISTFLDNMLEENENVEIRKDSIALKKAIEIINEISECGKLESNLRSLSPCIADADFWNEILNKRAQSRIMFKEGMGQTFHDSANGHREEYMLKYENEQMTIEDIYNRIDVYNLFIEQYEKYFIRCQELDIDIPSPIENKFFALIESLAGAELTLLLIKENFDEEIDEEKIFKVVERPNNGIVEDYEKESNKDLVDKDIFTYYKGYLFNGTLILHYEDSKHEISMRFGLKHGSYKKYDKKGKIIENNLAWNDKVFRSMPCK